MFNTKISSVKISVPNHDNCKRDFDKEINSFGTEFNKSKFFTNMATYPPPSSTHIELPTEDKAILVGDMFYNALYGIFYIHVCTYFT